MISRDLKVKVKEKMVATKTECHATGGGIFKEFNFSSLEASVTNLLQYQKQLHPVGDVLGGQSKNNNGPNTLKLCPPLKLMKT